MFICQVTGKSSKPGEKMNKLPVIKRDRFYFKKIKNEETERWAEVEVGKGWEIVREISVSDEGLAKWQAMSEQQKTNLLSIIFTKPTSKK